MKAWLIYSENDVNKNKRYIEFYFEEGKKRNIDIKLMLVENMEFGVKGGTWFCTYEREDVELPDFAVCRTIYPLLSKQLELMGVSVFNNSKVATICNDKAMTYQYVAQLGIPMVDTVFYQFKNHELAFSNLSSDKSYVMKAVAGHGGSQVFLYENKINEAKSEDVMKDEIIKGLHHEDFVVQPLTGSKRKDLRVYVIGKKIIASVMRTAQSGFKSNFSLGGEVELYELNQDEVELIDRIIHLFDFGMVGIDFIIGDDGELIFNEIEDVVGARMLYQCSDINLVGLYLDFIEDQLCI